MPFLFRTEIKESKVHGQGLHSLDFIPKGTVFWVWEGPNGIPCKNYETKPNRVFNKEQFLTLSPAEITKALHGGYYHAGSDVFCDLREGLDYTNHSEDWNCSLVIDSSKDYRDAYTVARKDIHPGDEITGYYGECATTKGDWVYELNLAYAPERAIIEDKTITEGNLA